MRVIRVFVVDDSSTARALVGRALEADPQLELAGEAADGKEAIERIAQARPDAVILDFEMPRMDGLQTVEALRREHPDLPIIMLSSKTTRGARVTVEAMDRGASDYLLKPSNIHDIGEAIAQLRQQLLPKLKALCLGRADTKDWLPTAAGEPPLTSEAERSTSQRIDIVTIGTSTGGPEALATVLGGLSGPPPVPIVVAVHMPPIFTKVLAERLTARSGIEVAEGRDGLQLGPGRILIAPGGDQHMVLVRRRDRVDVELRSEPANAPYRPSVDVLFRSAAQAYGAATLSLVLTGMGRDGAEGCRAVREAGGEVFAQNEASAIVWGMPGVVARQGLANRVVALEELANAVQARLAVERENGTAAGRTRPTIRTSGS